MLSPKIAPYLESNRPRQLAGLCELLRFPSMADVNPAACEQTVEWLVRHFGTLGMETKVLTTAGRPNVYAEARAGEGKPTLLVYGHYDVQPPDPLDLWQSPPFEPTTRDDCLFARGASDCKGQWWAMICAAEAFLRAGGGLPVNLKFFIEGEEEIGSPHLEPCIAAHKDLLKSDAIIISDSAFFAAGVPSIASALRGLAYFEFTVTGPSADLHSGANGGAVTNPLNALAKLLAGMTDATGRVTLPGFYDDVTPVPPAQLAAWCKLPFDEARYARELGVDALGGGEKGIPTLERLWSRPTLDVNGMVGGWTGVGAKTIIPARATAKVSCRLVVNQDPQKILAGARQYLEANVPAGCRVEMKVLTSARPVVLSENAPAMAESLAALKEGFGKEPVLVRFGASVPIAELFQRLLGVDPVLLGFGLPDDNIHSPNERLRLDQFRRGEVTYAELLQRVGESGLKC